MTKAKKARKPTRVADAKLSPVVRRLLAGVRKDVEPHGWSVHVEKSGTNLFFEFRNPLSPVWTGIGFDPDQPIAELRADIEYHMSAEPEFERTKKARPPARRRRVLGGLRWAATSYGWSDKVFKEVIDTLHHFRLLADDEVRWLKTIGPQVLSKDLERKWRKHVRISEGR
jgi:hypothetical protein